MFDYPPCWTTHYVGLLTIFHGVWVDFEGRDVSISTIKDRAGMEQLTVVNWVQVSTERGGGKREGGWDRGRKGGGSEHGREGKIERRKVEREGESVEWKQSRGSRTILLDDIDELLNADIVTEEVAHHVCQLAVHLLLQQLTEISTASNNTSI